jgi:hypothetical protein
MHRSLRILWPAFVMAGVLEMLVFAMVDPQDLHGFGGAPLDLSRQAIYTLAFMVFWAVIATAGAIMVLLEATPDELNADRGRAWPR